MEVAVVSVNSNHCFMLLYFTLCVYPLLSSLQCMGFIFRFPSLDGYSEDCLSSLRICMKEHQYVTSLFHKVYFLRDSYISGSAAP